MDAPNIDDDGSDANVELSGKIEPKGDKGDVELNLTPSSQELLLYSGYLRGMSNRGGTNKEDEFVLKSCSLWIRENIPDEN